MSEDPSNLSGIGNKIRQIRMSKNITLNNLSNETGLSKEFLLMVESGYKMPPVGVLLQISRALGIDSTYLIKTQNAVSEEERKKAYTKRTDNYAYTPLSSPSSNKHLKAFHIAIEPHSDHKGVGFQHEGEEFSYLLKGEVEITVGDNINRLRPGDSLHFNSSIKHNLTNVGDEQAELIVVVYTP